MTLLKFSNVKSGLVPKIVEDQNDIINIKTSGNKPNKTNHNTPGANKNKGLPIGPLRATNFFLFLYIFLSS